MNININTSEAVHINHTVLLKMKSLYTYLENDWTIRKNDNKYFIKNNESQRQILSDSYLKRYAEKNNKLSQPTPIEINLLAFFYNSLEDGWTITKNNDSYIFIKKHEGKKEIFSDTYLKRFMEDNFDINKILETNGN